ncbi:hypothetical protein AVE44_28770 [Salmonella enterica subsp. enterica serovar Typhimurium]|nr:hypothetical protein [Salmonella enterica subsp. enterica serovar Typhimurium]
MLGRGAAVSAGRKAASTGPRRDVLQSVRPFAAWATRNAAARGLGAEAWSSQVYAVHPWPWTASKRSQKNAERSSGLWMSSTSTGSDGSVGKWIISGMGCLPGVAVRAGTCRGDPQPAAAPGAAGCAVESATGGLPVSGPRAGSVIP